SFRGPGGGAVIPLDDPRWKALGKRGDIATRLRDLETASDVFSVTRAWDELGDAIYHQGDICLGSYAAVPHMVRICGTDRKKLDWNVFGWVAAIEEERWMMRPGNPA